MSFTQRITAFLGLASAASASSKAGATSRRSAVNPASRGIKPTHRSAVAIKKALGDALQDTLLQAGLLSAEYTFKVLTTVGDQAKHVLVVNLTRNLGGGQTQLAAAERLVALLARARYELEVTAVYWRVASLVTLAEAEVSPTLGAATAAMRGPSAKPAPLPLAQRLPKFYDDAPGHTEKDSEFPSTRAAVPDSDLMGLFP